MKASGKDGGSEGGKSRDDAESVLLEKIINEKEEGKDQKEQDHAHMLAPAHLPVDPAAAAVEIIPDSSDEAAEAARDLWPQGEILISRRPCTVTTSSLQKLTFLQTEILCQVGVLVFLLQKVSLLQKVYLLQKVSFLQTEIMSSRCPSIFTTESHKILTFQNLRQRQRATCGHKGQGEVGGREEEGEVEGQPV